MAFEFLVPALTALVAVAVFVAGDRLHPTAWRHTDDDTVGALVLNLINTIFMAVVAFIVVIAWQQYDNARNHTIAEAKALIDTYWAAHGMPEPDHARIQGLVREYTEQVLTEEWAVMADDGRLSQSTQDTLDDLRDAVAAVNSADDEVDELRTSAVAGLDAVAQARADRALDAAYRVPGFLYLAMWICTVLLLLSVVLSGVQVTKRSVVTTALLGAIVGVVIRAIYNLDEPFSGGNVVPKEAFELALSRYQHTT
ncbi:bestrophin-like domain [Nocardia sp. NPDC004573]